MNRKEKRELADWIARLQTKEGRESFKRTMCASDKDVAYEIDLARRVLYEQEQYEQLMKNLNQAAMDASQGCYQRGYESDENLSARLIQKALRQ